MAVVFALVLVALVLFATEPVPVDVTALGVMVALLLTEPLTQLLADAGLLAGPVLVLRTAAEAPAAAVEAGLSGFSSVATITVLAMFVLSEGVRRTGVISRVGAGVANLTGDDEGRQLGATVGIVGPLSGFINNTAAVAILLPMVTDLAHQGRNSPSKLLMPLSFASMFGGTLTLIGTSTNILASDLTARLLPEHGPIGMFEFTALGVVLLVVGSAYLLTVGRRLVPARIPPEEDLTAEFRMADYLTEVVVRTGSPLVGQTVGTALHDSDFDLELVQLVRGEDVFLEPLAPKQIQAGDTIALRTDRGTLVDLLDVEGLALVPDVAVTEADLETAEGGQNLVEVVVAPGSALVGNTLAETNFRERYDASVLALRRGEELIRQRLDDVPLRVGDTLLVQGATGSIERLEANPDLIVAQEIHRPDVRESKMVLSVGIVATVVLAAAFTPISIATAALAGAVGMVLTGCLRPQEVYEAVQWDVIFLLAGVIPL
ncbi:MAG: SLC13 family permease, partial [Haloarculaceae archaeon]